MIKDSGLDGFRLTGWPKSLETYGMPAATLERELSKGGLSIATMTFTAPAHHLEQQPVDLDADRSFYLDQASPVQTGK